MSVHMAFLASVWLFLIVAGVHIWQQLIAAIRENRGKMNDDC